MKTILVFAVVFGMMGGTIAWQHSRIKKIRAENSRLENNASALMEGIRLYRTKDSLYAASTGALELKLTEFRKLRSEDARLIETLKIRLNRVEQVSRHATETHHQITAPLRDTAFIERDYPDSGRLFSYRSPYIDLEGVLQRDSVRMTLTSYDTLMQVTHRIPKRFLFIRYGTKAIRQEIVSKNPHTKITYTEYIRLKR